MQSRVGSLVEATTSTLVGFLVAVLTQVVVFPIYGLEVGLGGNLQIALIFTVVSVLRGYCIRRLFNRNKFVKRGGKE